MNGTLYIGLARPARGDGGGGGGGGESRRMCSFRWGGRGPPSFLPSLLRPQFQAAAAAAAVLCAGVSPPSRRIG